MAYAQGTCVSAERSRAEIESVLRRYGASQFGYLVNDSRATIMFCFKSRAIRMVVPQANPNDFKYNGQQRYRHPTEQARRKYVDKESRRRWRALLLVVKAKLEAVQSKIATIEEEFLAYTVTSTGQTVAEMLAMEPGKITLALPEAV